MKRRVSIAAAGLLLAGCTVGPNYAPADMKTPDTYRETDAAHQVAAPVDVSAWWLQFGDAQLQDLIARALQANTDLQVATARIRRARAEEIVAGAAASPRVGATGLAAKLHSNASLLPAQGNSSGSSQGNGGGSTDIDIYSVGFDATWELDIFGRVRRSVEAARANTDAAVWQMRDAQVTLAAEVGNAYVALRAIQARIAVLRSEYENEQGTLKLVGARARTGFISQLEVNQQQSVAATTASEIPDLEAQARVFEHALAVLVGAPPATLIDQLEAPAAVPPIPPRLPVGLPSDLLRRRPDVRAAERQVAAATAQEGVAVANLYPRFNLIGALSLAGNSLGNLFSTNSLSEIGAGQISWPVFQGGALHANIRARQADVDAAYASYKGAVLKAIQDVEDALVRFNKEQARLAELKIATDTGRSSLDIALQQYRVGLVSYVNVLTAQSQYRAAQDQLMQSRQALAQDLISIYKALGGGWSAGETQAEDQRGAASG
jgi:NodT family efflux transporter outer membrane factor (OMF) lipoprotein